MRLAHFGTFDVPNYGDLLFPRLVEFRLGDMFTDIVHISPVGDRSVYRDVRPSKPLSAVIAEDLQFDAVLIGGGNILHSKASNLDYYEPVRETAYPRLWLGAAQLASRQGIPLAINASGVPHAFGRLGRPLMRMAGTRADYLAVRDTYSREMMARAGVSADVVPDSALELANFFGKQQPLNFDVPAELEAVMESSYLAVHINDRYFDGDIDGFAQLLDRLSKAADATIVLVAIGPCHGDDKFAKAVGSRMKSSPVIYSHPKAVEDIAFVISKSAAYVGSSMHGFITATSYRVPGLLIAKHTAQHKFRGLLNHLGAEHRLTGSWSEALAVFETRGGVAQLFEAPRLEEALQQIDRHWQSIRETFTHSAPKKSAVLRWAPDLAQVFDARGVAQGRRLVSKQRAS
jgi:polysaccharide pyruvyl transferase WcaK-like protein